MTVAAVPYIPVIRWIAPIILTFGLAAALVWAFREPGFDPAITAFGLLASLAAVLGDRWLAERQRRREMLRAVVHELYANQRVIEELNSLKQAEYIGQANAYPRYLTVALSGAIASGFFAEGRDARLFYLMHMWLQRATECNVRLNIMELMACLRADAPHDRLNTLTSEGAVARAGVDACQALIHHLMNHYPKESGLDWETKLFPTE